MNYKQILTAIATTVILASCHKEERTEEPAKVDITISAPMDGQVFKSGDTVQITANGTSTGELHGYETQITDTATGTIVFDDEQHAHTDHFAVNSKWAGTVTGPVVLRVSVTAVVDHNGNTVKKEVYFKMEP